MKTLEVLEFSEPRFPKEGEWYKNDRGEIIQAMAYFAHEKYPIVTRHKIEVPEVADIFHWQFSKKTDEKPKGICAGIIPLTPPKPRRCRWINPFPMENGLHWSTAGLYTEEEIKAEQYFGCAMLEPIRGTEE